ncbi:MAG: DUF932 domain-containing protein, partial [Planctomycetales bacterium]|nr:DUF932 domain-containing protein [Planctomycetales bacterium]
LEFDYGLARVREIGVRLGPSHRQGPPAVTGIRLRDEWHRPSKRFWNSFFRRFHATENIFRYFTHAEVFQRISAKAADESFRYCIERRAGGRSKLLAVSNPDRPVICHQQLEGLAKRYDACNVNYEDGVVTSQHVPRTGDHPITIGTDEFRQRFVLETSIDGYGSPRIFLSLLRAVCSNGMIGYAPAFR